MSEAILRILEGFFLRRNSKVNQDGNERDCSRTVTVSNIFLLVVWAVVLIVLLLSPGGLLGNIFPLH